MTPQEVAMDIRSLTRQGFSLRAISERLGIHRNTAKKYRDGPVAPRYRLGKRAQAVLSPFRQMIEDWLAEEPYRATWIFLKLKPLGYAGGYDTVKRYVSQVKAQYHRQAFLRFETVPGLQGQVDWADFKVARPGGRDLTVYLFAMVLGFSRTLYAELVTRCTLESFLDAHLRAFRYLGGVPCELLYDRMRQVFTGRGRGVTAINSEFAHFAHHCGFKPVVCPPYSPWVKGKVERPIDYIREGFWRGYRFQDLAMANLDLRAWLTATANCRIHGTHRQAVDLRWEQERSSLSPIPPDYDTALKLYRKVYKDCLISYRTNRYQVPPEAIGKRVLLKIKDGTLRIYDDDRLLITHTECPERGRMITDPAVIAQILRQRLQRPQTPPYGRRKAKATRGLSSGSLFPQVLYRPLAVYEQLAQSGGGVWTN
jgi:transposase